RGFPAVTPPADPGQPQPVPQRDIQAEADAFKDGMPELFLALGGDLQVLEDAEPDAIMILAINLAYEKSGRVDQLETKLEDADDRYGKLNLLYTFSQVALQKAVSGSDCVDTRPSNPEAVKLLIAALNAPMAPSAAPTDKEAQARESWAGPEAVTTPRMAAAPFVKLEPSPHPKTIPMPPPKSEPEPGKSGQGNG
ncbi:MAG: hypothetical protein ACYC44_01590, partial [Patescibacteria group bacterium]